MCDFRSPPTGMRDIANNQIITISFMGTAKGYGSPNDEDHMSHITQSGMYHVGGTGCYYSFFDGEKWYSSWNDKYEFLFDSEHGCGILDNREVLKLDI